MAYRILDPVSDYAEWQRLAPPDLYYSADFAILSQISFGNSPQAFVYEDERGTVFYPFVRRLINSLPFFSGGKLWFDIISFEMGGPHIVGNPEIWIDFEVAFKKWCASENIVAEYSRSHPILQTERWMPEAVQTKEIIYIDLAPSEEKIFASFAKKTRQSTRNAEKRGVTIRETREKADIREFCRIYTSTMDRHQSNEYSYLRPTFFENTLWLLKDNARLYVAEHNGKIICGSIVLFKNGIAYDYYRGSDIGAQSLRPSNLIVWHIARGMKKLGCEKYVLGSGFAAGDLIYRFKRGFSDMMWPFWVHKKVHNQDMYDKLCGLRKKFGSINNSEFFPLYREGLA